MGPPASHSSVKTRDQGLGTRDQGPRDQGTRDQGTRDQGTRGPGDQGTRGPGDQGTRGPGDQGTRTEHCGNRRRVKENVSLFPSLQYIEPEPKTASAT